MQQRETLQMSVISPAARWTGRFLAETSAPVFVEACPAAQVFSLESRRTHLAASDSSTGRRGLSRAWSEYCSIRIDCAGAGLLT
jgi:hypothetical protein